MPHHDLQRRVERLQDHLLSTAHDPAARPYMTLAAQARIQRYVRNPDEFTAAERTDPAMSATIVMAERVAQRLRTWQHERGRAEHVDDLGPH